jgi:hypothetical protein
MPMRNAGGASKDALAFLVGGTRFTAVDPVSAEEPRTTT